MTSRIELERQSRRPMAIRLGSFASLHLWLLVTLFVVACDRDLSPPIPNSDGPFAPLERPSPPPRPGGG